MHTAMDDDLLTNFVAAAPAPLNRSAERTKLKRLQRHKGLVSLFTSWPDPPPHADTLQHVITITVACCAEERCCLKAWQAGDSAAASAERA